MSASARAPWVRDGLASAGAFAAPAPPRRLSGRTAVGLAAVLAILASLGQAGAFSPDARLVNPRGWPQLARFLGAALRPELDPAFLALTLHAAGQTLAFAVLGTLLSLILGSAFGLLSSEAWWRAVLPLRRQGGAVLGQTWWWPWTAVRSVLALPRAIHEVIWGLLLINVLGLDPLTAVLAIGIPYGAIVAKVYAEILDEAWPPRLPAGGLAELGRLSAQTLSMSVLAMGLAASLGLLLAFPAAAGWTGRRKRFGDPVAWGLSRGLLLLIRAVPPPIWALVAIWVFFPGTLPGALALAAYTTGILGRLMAEVLENADLRPARALAALGARGPALVAYAVLPPTLPRYASYVLYRWEVCIRTTVVVGLVGAGGLGQIMRQQIAGFDYHGLGSTLACFVVLTALVDAASARLRRILR